MKIKLLLSFLALLALGTACEKPEKPQPIDQNPLGNKPPCYGSFSCTINGEPFQSYGTGGGCSPRSIFFNPTSKNLHVSGIDCRVEKGFRGVVFEADSVNSAGIYPLPRVNCGYVIVLGNPVPYNTEIAGELKISQLIKPPFSDAFEGGYIEGTFWFTSYSNELEDTVKVTNGQFCGTF